MLGELYSSALAVSAFNWDCAPAVTELEIVVMDWLVKMFSLPSCFLSTTRGGGVMQGSTSEAVLSLMVAARERYLAQNTGRLSGNAKEEARAQRRLRMVALASDAAHSCTEKAAMVLGIRYRSVPVRIEDGFSMTGAALAAVLQQCYEEGLEPFYLTATLGTTATCAVDRFDEVAHVLKDGQIWVHVDAAYAGAALVCEEYQQLTRCLGEFDSFSMSMSKWLLTNIDAVYVAILPASILGTRFFDVVIIVAASSRTDGIWLTPSPSPRPISVTTPRILAKSLTSDIGVFRYPAAFARSKSGSSFGRTVSVISNHTFGTTSGSVKYLLLSSLPDRISSS